MPGLLYICSSKHLIKACNTSSYRFLRVGNSFSISFLGFEYPVAFKSKMATTTIGLNHNFFAKHQSEPCDISFYRFFGVGKINFDITLGIKVHRGLKIQDGYHRDMVK